MNYCYPTFRALRFKCKGGGINCFWTALFFGIRIEKTKSLGVLNINYRRFQIFWSSFFEGIRSLFTGKVF